MEAKIFKLASNFCTFLLYFLIILNIHQTLAARTSCTESPNKNYLNFIQTSCNSTTYPSLCYDSLSPYASKIKTNPLQLVKTALSVTLKSAKECSSLVSTLGKQKGLGKPEKAVIRDCKEEIQDVVDEIKKSLDALKTIKESTGDKEFQMANILTWMSAAITDESTCSDEFEEMDVSPALKSQVNKCLLNLFQLTSSTLALVNQLH